MAIKKLTKTISGPRPTTPQAVAAGQVPVQQATHPDDYPWSDTELLAVTPASVTTALVGDSGTGKSTCAASWPKTPDQPQLVLAFDPPAKMYPYKEGYNTALVDDPYYAELGIYAEAVLDGDGKELRRIEYYIDPDPLVPRAAAAVEARLSGFEAVASQWSSVVFDSMTFYQYASLRRARYQFPMPAGKEQGSNLAWYNQVKGDVERVVKSQAVWWPTRTIFCFHTNEEKAEFASETLRGLLAVGKLPAELPPGFSELYHFFIKRGGDEHQYWAQTKHDGIWMATSIIAHAPNPCEPTFRALWSNFLKTRRPTQG